MNAIKHTRFLIIFFIAILGIFIFYFAYNFPVENETENPAAETENPTEVIQIVSVTEMAAAEPVTALLEEAVPSEPEPPAEYRISFTGTGDIIAHECLWIDARNRAIPGERAYNFMPMFADVADMIAEADIAFINQETPMAGNSFELSGYPLFNSPQDLGHDLAELGFDVINIATNHMIDKGASGLINTVNFLRSLDTMLIGDYLNQDELYKIKVIERGGIKIAFLAYTYSTNGLRLPADSEIVIPYINEDLIISQVAKAKEIADAVIISIHWGEENSFKPTSRQRQLAQLMADLGVLAVIGHHPHVLQPVEWLEGSGGNRTLCVYSLGNLASGMIRPMNMVGGFISFDIVMQESTVTLEKPVFTPIIYYYARNWLNGYVYLLKDYTVELSRSHGTFTRHEFADTLEDLWHYVTKNIDAEFLD